MTYISRSLAVTPARPAAQPYHELPVPAAVLHALAWQAIGVFGLICHIVLVKEVNPACIVVCMAGLAWLASHKPLPAFIVFLLRRPVGVIVHQHGGRGRGVLR